MEFKANEKKNVEIVSNGVTYERHAIATHFVEIGEDYMELVERYVKPIYEEGWILSISEKIIALCQKRVVYKKDMKISFLAKFLSRFAMQHNSAGIGVGEVCKMQFAIDHAGAWRVFWAAVCAGFGKLCGKRGVWARKSRVLTGSIPMSSPFTGSTASAFPKTPPAFATRSGKSLALSA